MEAWIGLGSNLGEPRTQLREAFGELARLPRSRLLARSSLYRSAPMGPPDQPDYLNAVARLETDLEPLELLDALQAIEADHRRERGERWGPRTLDLDLLLYGGRIIDHPRLRVPHPGLYERNFVLYPLAELAPGLTIPGHGPLGELLAHCPRGSLAVEEAAPPAAAHQTEPDSSP